TGAVNLNTRLALNQTSIEGLVLSGGNGDDTFNIPGNHPYAAGIGIQGGDPSASDVVNFTASATVANLITVDFGASTVQEATFGAVSLSGVELLNANASAHNLTVNGTTGNDAISVTPTGAAAATVILSSGSPSVGSVPVVNALGIGTTLIVD